jgi:hypothetical protein
VENKRRHSQANGIGPHSPSPVIKTSMSAWLTIMHIPPFFLRFLQKSLFFLPIKSAL